ncbi:MAG: hypothetical protein ABIQ01_12280 [Pseudolysinimonas sp.]
MTGRTRTLGAAVAVLALVGLQLLLTATPASAEPSQISFVTASPVQTAFGGNWNVQMSVRFAAQSTVPIPAEQASVDIYLSGQAAPFASHLPIQPDGSVFVSQATTTTLAPGEYQMTAQLVPVTGSFIEGSQTATPLVLSISAYSIDAKIDVDAASVAAGEPVIEARLSGQFVDTTEAVPAGTWAFTITSGGTTVLETEVAQDAGADDALRYAITEKLDKGRNYQVAATFTPIEALAAGLEVAQPSDVTFHTPDGGLGDPVPYPLWLLILTCVLPLALAAAVIVLTVRIGGRRAVLAGGGPAGSTPTAPTEEFVQVEDLFPLQQAAGPPAQYPVDTPTQVLPPAQPAPYPPGQDWSLDGPPEETPTERIDPGDPDHLR